MPVGVRRFHSGFLVPLSFGPQADWCRNVLAGGCVVQWKGARYVVVEAEVVDAASIRLELREAI